MSRYLGLGADEWHSQRVGLFRRVVMDRDMKIGDIDEDIESRKESMQGFVVALLVVNRWE